MADHINLAKSYEFFNAEMIEDRRVHIVGCGSVGATIAELLARYGITKMRLYDFDTVEPHNIHNQIFTQSHVGMKKLDALQEIILGINPEAADGIELVHDGWTGQTMQGYIFLAVDNIETRRKIAEQHQGNPYVYGMFDVRTRLTDAQSYGADWKDPEMVKNFIASMDFTHEEAKEETPVSACNVALSSAATVRGISTLCVLNFIEFARVGVIRKMILADFSTFIIDAF